MVIRANGKAVSLSNKQHTVYCSGSVFESILWSCRHAFGVRSL